MYVTIANTLFFQVIAPYKVSIFFFFCFHFHFHFRISFQDYNMKIKLKVIIQNRIVEIESEFRLRKSSFFELLKFTHWMSLDCGLCNAFYVSLGFWVEEMCIIIKFFYLLDIRHISWNVILGARIEIHF